MEQKKIAIVLLALILISTILEFKFGNLSLTPIQGNWENNDQILQVPAIYKLSKENLFVNDIIIAEYIKIYPTLLFYLVAGIYNLFSNMALTYFLLFISLKIIFIISVFLLSRILLKNDRHALFATVFMSFTHFMGADEIGLSEVVPKNFVFAFMPLVFYLFLKDRKKYSIHCSVFLSFLAHFHIFSIVPVILLFSYSYLSRKEYRLLIQSLTIFAFLAAPFLVLTNQHAGSIDAAILSVVPYANLANSLFTVAKFAPLIAVGFLALLGPQKLDGIFGAIKNVKKELLAWFIILTLYSLLSLGGIFSKELLLITFYRAFKYVVFFSFIFLAAAIYYIFNKQKFVGLALSIIVLLYFSSIYYSTIFDGITKNKAAYSAEINDVIKLGDWMDKTLDKNETVLIPPDWGVIRVWGKRPVVLADTDLYILYFSADRFPDKKFYNNISQAYKAGDGNAIIQAAKQKNIKYVITYKNPLNASQKFESGNFKVYYLG